MIRQILRADAFPGVAIEAKVDDEFPVVADVDDVRADDDEAVDDVEKAEVDE